MALEINIPPSIRAGDTQAISGGGYTTESGGTHPDQWFYTYNEGGLTGPSSSSATSTQEIQLWGCNGVLTSANSTVQTWGDLYLISGHKGEKEKKVITEIKELKENKH